MGCVEITNNDKVWEVIYASVFLDGEEREQALKQLNVPTEECA